MNELGEGGLHLFILLVPPAPEIGNLDVSEAALGVVLGWPVSERYGIEARRRTHEAARDGVEDVLHSGVLDRVVRSVVVLIDGLKPADVLWGGKIARGTDMPYVVGVSEDVNV